VVETLLGRMALVEDMKVVEAGNIVVEVEAVWCRSLLVRDVACETAQMGRRALPGIRIQDGVLLHVVRSILVGLIVLRRVGSLLDICSF
jgi:hypothetical protein